jgi:hypothetical protein
VKTSLKFTSFIKINKLFSQQYQIKLIFSLLHIKENNFYLKLKIYIIISLFCLFVCVCVKPAIDSAPGGHTDMRPVSLEPVWPGEVPSGEIFFKKWPVAELPKKKVKPLMLFYG